MTERQTFRMRLGAFISALFATQKMTGIPQTPYRSGTPGRRTRIPGKARPAGAKLARKAANGEIGKGHPR